MNDTPTPGGVERPRALCIGGAHLDQKARATATIVLGTSIPVHVTTVLGGVARNVAENFSRLGFATELVSRVGTDSAGTRVLRKTAQSGVNVTGVSRSPRLGTASYVALLDHHGELVVGLADMAVYDEITSDLIMPRIEQLRPSDVLFIDANVPQRVIQELLSDRRNEALVVANAVSPAKAERFRPVLSCVDVLVCNVKEAAILANIPLERKTEVAEVGKLLSHFVPFVVITAGREGALAISAGRIEAVRADAIAATDVTGAGDALLAAFVYSLQRNGCLRQALSCGVAAATLAVQVEDSAPSGLSPCFLEGILHDGACDA